MLNNESKILLQKLQEENQKLTNENKALKNKKEQLGLVWENKPDAQALKLNNHVIYLSNETERNIIHDSIFLNHVLINADNFHALTVLKASHSNKVNVIYIDPPYNTGNKDFIYNDNYLDKDDKYHHSKWLSFMEKRLILARELLAEDGVIFVSIGHHEQARLKLLMDQVFNAKNEIGMFVWEKSSGSQNKLMNISQEYILTYAKNKPKVKKWEAPRDQDIVKALYSIVSNENKTIDAVEVELKNKIKQLINNNPDEYSWLTNYVRVTPHRKIFYGKDLSTPGTPNTITLSNGKILEPLPNRRWQTKKRIDSLIENNRIEWRGESQRPYEIHYLEESVDNINSIIKNVFTRNGKEDLKAIFGDKIPFDYPKPKKLITKLLEFSTDKDSVVLDFFAGSGTTGHAVLELNEKDNGQRQFILVTDGGKIELTGESSKNSTSDAINIAEEVTYERLRRVITGKDWSNGKLRKAYNANLFYFNTNLIEIAESPSKAPLLKILTDAHKIGVKPLHIPLEANQSYSENEVISYCELLIDAHSFAQNILP